MYGSILRNLRINYWYDRPSDVLHVLITTLSETKRKVVKMLYPNIDESSGMVHTYLLQQMERYHEYDISTSLWDCFKMDVATACRFWW